MSPQLIQPQPSLKVVPTKDGRRAIVIRTSDRIAFKKCRRQWGWSSHLKKNLGSKYLAGPLWFGSAIHYALEDYHGHNVFGRPAEAFKAYCLATAKNHVRDLPDDAQELWDLGIAMMDYYVDFWLHPMTMRKPDQTYWLDGVPQVEVNFEIEVPLADNPVLADLARRQGADCILYRGTIDRMVQDPETGFLWVDEYKTAKVAEHFHYQTDPQCTTYVWAASHIYDQPVAGVIYHQFIKKMPEAPRILSSGKISTASNLTTSYPLYKNALVQMYGSVESAPKSNVEFLTNLAMSESVDRDKYIVREKVYRNNHTLEAEAQKILLEMEDMLNPDLPLYPNPTRDCSRMCSFLAACVSMDDGGDWEEELAQEYADRDQAADRMWRKRLPPPEALLAMRDAGEKLPRLEDIQIQIKSMSDNRRAEMDAGIFTFD